MTLVILTLTAIDPNLMTFLLASLPAVICSLLFLILTINLSTSTSLVTRASALSTRASALASLAFLPATLAKTITITLPDLPSPPSLSSFSLPPLSSLSFSDLLIPLLSLSILVIGCLLPSPHLFPKKTTTKTLNDDAKLFVPSYSILPLLNLLVTTTFLATTLLFLTTETPVLNFLLVWSACIAYFLGFFGMSFVDTDTMTRTPVVSMTSLCESEGIKKGMKRAPKSEMDLTTPLTAILKSDLKSEKKKETEVKARANPTSTTEYLAMTDSAIADLVTTGAIKHHTLEKLLGPVRAVTVRRLALGESCPTLKNLPCDHAIDYERIHGANCELVVGFIPIPVGMAGPVRLNGRDVFIPMATTEGCLVASTNRGCKAINLGTGATSTLIRDGITRAPCLRFPTATKAAEFAGWSQESASFDMLKAAFESTTSFGKLVKAEPTVAGRNVYLRLVCFSGDAMGMNMVSKGSLAVVSKIQELFVDCKLVALSGNMCTDKKAAATNWIHGRGKSIVIEAVIPKAVVTTVLKTTVAAIVDVNTQKNLIGSAMAASVGGFNCHAANNVTAVFLATGQDPAQNVESSNCITLLEGNEDGDLWISCTMPSIEVGTVGGGTSLPAQAALLGAIGCSGGGVTPGANAANLAHVVAAAVMAGELSLLAALAQNTLVSAHMQHNRKPTAGK